ncbi:hypothetical protein ACFL02_00070 [Planctomycetota bacterium]
MQTDLLKLSGQAALVVLIIALLAVWPCRHFSPEQGITALITAAAVCFGATCVSLLPLVIAVKRRADWLGQACLGGTVIRLLLTMFAGTVVYFALKPPMMTFALCVMAFYLALLAWETKVAVSYIRVFYPTSSSTGNEKKNDTDNKPDKGIDNK